MCSALLPPRAATGRTRLYCGRACRDKAYIKRRIRQTHQDLQQRIHLLEDALGRRDQEIARLQRLLPAEQIPPRSRRAQGR